MTTRKEYMTELCARFDLVIEEDIKKLPIGGKTVAIITRSGIEKIQFASNISVGYEVCLLGQGPSGNMAAIIKATAKKGEVFMESFGEAEVGVNCRSTYPVAMAEKRALARAVLKITGAYKFGVFGEDEADDFKRENKDER
tara:strand:+ start:189 stop:611 length:423 start_codon:yes stop_codon:yes gene_type:complete